jgi:hypothetical protein
MGASRTPKQGRHLTAAAYRLSQGLSHLNRRGRSVSFSHKGILMHARHLASLAAVVVVAVIAIAPASAYIHFPPLTMPKICEQSRAIRVLTVKKHNKEKGVIVFEATETLKGKTPDGTLFKHVIGKEDKGTKPIFDWVADGKQAMMFTIETGPSGIACGYVFIDKYCYSVDRNGTGEFWLLIRADPQMAATFHGTIDTLRKVTKDLLAGKEVKVPVDESVKALTIKDRQQQVQALNEVLKKNREK